MLDRRGAGAELARYVVDFMLWVLEDASNAPLAREMCAANHPQPPHQIGFAQALWSALAVQGESQDELRACYSEHVCKIRWMGTKRTVLMRSVQCKYDR